MYETNASRDPYCRVTRTFDIYIIINNHGMTQMSQYKRHKMQRNSTYILYGYSADGHLANKMTKYFLMPNYSPTMKIANFQKHRNC